MLNTGTIYGINGPVIYLKGNTGFRMSEMVYVGREKLVGEVISLDKDLTTVQVYEETSGLCPGEEVIASGSAVSVTLAPGILNNIFDGIERPLEKIAENSGAFITRGVSVDSLDRSKKWPARIVVSKGDYLHAGDIIAEVPETHAILHKCMVPPNMEGTVTDTAEDGEYTIDEPLVTLELSDGTLRKLTMTQHWPIRTARPTHHRFPASTPLITGQRVIDTMFPIAKGGTAAIPGGFRYRQDHDAAPDCKMVRRRHYHLHRLRRARQRDDPGSGRIRRTDRPKDRQSSDGPHHADCKYLQHAGCCP